jgi:hypothetical protein
MAFAVNAPRRSQAASAAAGLMITLARVIHAVVGVVVLLIVLAIVLRVAAANGHNAIVRDIHDAARALVGPFRNVFLIRNPKDAIAVNWGLAAVVYLLAGWSVAALLDRAAPRAGRLAQGSA